MGLSLLYTAHFERDGEQISRRFVTRAMPHPDDLPVYPTYDVEREGAVMEAVRSATDLPVPEVLVTEPTGSIIGLPFLILEAMPGEAPLDNLPYVFGSWLSEATPEQQQQLETATIEALAKIHTAPAPQEILLADGDERSPLRAHLDESREYYEWTVQGGERIPLLDEAFEWLEANFPAEESDSVLLWGDARFGPPETDLAWMLSFHWMFQDQAAFFQVPGMPDFHKLAPGLAAYEAASGRTLTDMHFHLVYAAARTATVMARIGRRSIMLGDREAPENADELVLNAGVLRGLLDGNREF